ncbi:MAG: serine/threonine protein kinase [Nitrospira sp.]|nr:serine/threonine protein kinase [bacterium]MBL7048630.1 serine/threonine protein kinase [Nitrospira sp.]
MIAQYLPPARVPRSVRIITDTSDFFRVDYDDVVMLNGLLYLIRNYKREGRFGISDQPKFWVKSAIDLQDGSVKIIKMVYHEKFTSSVGNITFDCFRSPKKEARILTLVKGHQSFMQGYGVEDSVGNVIRVIDLIKGPTIEDYVLTLGDDHEDYFYNHFPLMLQEYTELVKAIKFLHKNGEKHGDIRRDHVFKDAASGDYKWIDFDFNYMHKENMFGYDLFGLGNILAYLTGRGDVTTQELRKADNSIFRSLAPDDLNIIFNNRVVNLKKVYPYIPEVLNIVLMHFSTGAHIFYDNVDQLLQDLDEVRHAISGMSVKKGQVG